MLLGAPAGAAAATPVKPRDLTGLTAKARVQDRILPARRIANAAGANTQVFTDQNGYRITVSTDIPNLDLAPFAAILAGTIHHAEIQDLVTEVVPPEGIPVACGSAAAAACYMAEDPVNNGRGRIWVPSAHPDLPHILTHEYGHHIDNQLLNLAHLGACTIDSDGSRNWFIERELADLILDSGLNCDPASNWETLLGELYAEDFVSANGFSGWVLTSVEPPSTLQLEALKYDIAHPFAPARKRWKPMVRKRRARYKRIRVDSWTFLTVKVTGPRRADLDLYLYRGNSARPLKRSARRGSRERIVYILEPFRSYDIGVSAFKRKGRAKVTIDLE